MGEPDRAIPYHSNAEYIGIRKATQGSEPSQYLEEKKASAISKVAASEIETAQTIFVFKPAGVAKVGL